MVKLNDISTEKQNLATINIDQVSTLEITKLINQQDKQIAIAIESQLQEIAKVIDLATNAIKKSGRVIYFGAGTSGRLGILDASEMLPTFGEKDWFIGLIAGGEKAIIHPVENAEDNEKEIIQQLNDINFTKNDFLIGIAASGRTPYVLAGLKYAQKIKALSASISTSKNAPISKVANIAIEAITGPETITGSTRMKSGTAQKMILNMISTGVMVKLNKTYGNLMVDVKPTNAKLIVRATKLVEKIAKVNFEIASKQLKKAKYNVKAAIIMIIKQVDYHKALSLLKQHNFNLRELID